MDSPDCYYSFEFFGKVKDKADAIKTAGRTYLPKYSYTIFFVSIAICVAAFVYFELPVTKPLIVISVLFAFVLIINVLKPYIMACKSNMHSKAVNGGKVVPSRVEFSDKIHITDGNIKEEFDFDSITGVYELKNIIVIKIYKGLVMYVPKDAIVQGDIDSFLTYIESFVKPENAKNKLKILFTVLLVFMIILSVILTMLILIKSIFVL